jgi:hypothetical protein
MLTGRPPFVGDSAVAVAYQHVRERPQPPSALNRAVPQELDRVLLRALAKSREGRYQTAEEFRHDLEAALNRTAPPPPVPPLLRPRQAETERLAATAPYRDDDDGGPAHREPADRDQRRRAYGAAAVVALAVGALVVWLVPKGGDGSQPTGAGVTASVSPAPVTVATTGATTAAGTTAPVTTASASLTATPTATSRVAVAPPASRSASLSPTPTTSGTTSATTVAAGWGGPCTGTAQLTNSWDGAYQALISIRNGAGAPVPESWTVVVTLPAGQTLVNGWDATVSGIGTGTVTAAPYSPGPLSAGGTSSFVIQVSAPDPVLPSAFRINRVVCG